MTAHNIGRRGIGPIRTPHAGSSVYRHVESTREVDLVLSASAPELIPSRSFGESSDALPSGHAPVEAVPTCLGPIDNLRHCNCDIPESTYNRGPVIDPASG
jgi:hypothetical protein